MGEAREYGNSGVSLPDGRVVFASAGLDEPQTCAGALYQPDDESWMLTGRFPGCPVGGPAALLRNGLVLSVNTDQRVNVLDTSLLYWTPVQSPRFNPYASTLTALLDGRALLVGGTSRGCEIYDPVDETWSLCAQTLEVRILHTATLLSDGRVLVVGGISAGQRPKFMTRLQIVGLSLNPWCLGGHNMSPPYSTMGGG
jgi:hypothetical protein